MTRQNADKCRCCGSMAINPHCHDRRNDVDLDLCDVCYWRVRAEAMRHELQRLSDLVNEDDVKLIQDVISA